jgi:hypothetical protein
MAMLASVAYLTWRATSTLPLSVWWLSVPLWLLEVHAAIAFGRSVFTATEASGRRATLTGCLDAWRTLGYLLVPMVVLLTGANPIDADAITFTLAYLPTVVLHQWAIRRLGRGRGCLSRSMLGEVIALPAGLPARLALRAPAPRFHAALFALGALSALWYALSAAGWTSLHYGAPVTASAGWLALNMTMLAVAIRRIRARCRETVQTPPLATT